MLDLLFKLRRLVGVVIELIFEAQLDVALGREEAEAIIVLLRDFLRRQRPVVWLERAMVDVRLHQTPAHWFKTLVKYIVARVGRETVFAVIARAGAVTVNLALYRLSATSQKDPLTGRPEFVVI